MDTLKIYYPFKPFIVTQAWGNPNSAYALQFGDPNFKIHNGIDAIPNFKDTYLVYCPVAGFRVAMIRYNPQGGGHEIWLISKEKVKMFERECRAYMVLCHAKKILVPVGYEPELGELIMIGDNTGFSTGPHTHIGLYRVDYDDIRMTFLDQNEATGSFAPELFFTGEFATDKATFAALFRSGMRYYNYVLTGT